MHGNRLRRSVEFALQIETSHQVTVEVRRHATRVFHAHVQHEVLVHRRNAHLVSDVRRGTHVVPQFRRLHRRPRRVVEVLSIPTLRHSGTAVPHLPTVVIDLERQHRREHRRHRRRRCRHLTHLEHHRAHVHRQVPAGGVDPTVTARVVQHQRVDVVRRTEVGVVQTARHLERGV